MLKPINPASVAKPSAKYAHAVAVPTNAKRLIISGQVGVAFDGTVRQGLEAQVEQCWANILAILVDQGLGPANLVKVTTFVVERGKAGILRPIRDKAMAGHLCAHTYLEVAGLASSEYLVEIEAEAASV
jgi:2-iminobutanoate/2-iminopropanoate deaminase